MIDDTAGWKHPGATARGRVAAIWRHFAPTSAKYQAMVEAMERALDEHAASARREVLAELRDGFRGDPRPIGDIVGDFARSHGLEPPP